LQVFAGLLVWPATVATSSDWCFVERWCGLLPLLFVPAMGMADARSVDSKHHGWSKVSGLAAVSKILESLDMAEGGFGRA